MNCRSHKTFFLSPFPFAWFTINCWVWLFAMETISFLFLRFWPIAIIFSSSFVWYPRNNIVRDKSMGWLDSNSTELRLARGKNVEMCWEFRNENEKRKDEKKEFYRKSHIPSDPPSSTSNNKFFKTKWRGKNDTTRKKMSC